MSWRAVRLPVLAIAGFAAPGLLVVGFKKIPKEWLEIRREPAVMRIEQPAVNPVALAQNGPVTSFDPFRRVFAKPVSSGPIVETPASVSVSTQTAPPTPRRSVPAAQPAPQEDLPDPKLEGVVAGDDPIAVIKVGEDSQFVRVGQKLAGGIVVTAISDGEVRLKRGSTELVLKTGIR